MPSAGDSTTTAGLTLGEQTSGITTRPETLPARLKDGAVPRSPIARANVIIRFMKWLGGSWEGGEPGPGRIEIQSQYNGLYAPGSGAVKQNPKRRTELGDGATRYDGPVVTVDIRAGGRRIKLVRPGDPDRMLEEPGVLAWNRADDYMPYWAYLWPGAFLLAEAVAQEPWPEGVDAMEIGCGLGLGGLVALTRGLRVQFTDYDLTPLDFVVRTPRRTVSTRPGSRRPSSIGVNLPPGAFP